MPWELWDAALNWNLNFYKQSSQFVRFWDPCHAYLAFIQSLRKMVASLGNNWSCLINLVFEWKPDTAHWVFTMKIFKGWLKNSQGCLLANCIIIVRYRLIQLLTQLGKYFCCENVKCMRKEVLNGGCSLGVSSCSVGRAECLNFSQ